MKRIVYGAAALALAVLGGHQLLVRHGAACPMHAPTAAELDAQRKSTMASFATNIATPAGAARTTDGLVLGETSRERFLATFGACERELAGTHVRCAAKDGVETLGIFDERGILTGVDRVHYGFDVASGGRAFDEALASSRAKLGEPQKQWGALPDRPLRQEGFAYRFATVAIDVTATHLGDGGVVLREQHRSIPTS